MKKRMQLMFLYRHRQVAEYQQYQEATAEDEEPEGEYEEEGVPEE